MSTKIASDRKMRVEEILAAFGIKAGGTVSGTVTATDVQKIGGQTLRGGNFNDAIAIIRSGEAYANVHTTNFPGGEIRGQVSVQED